MFTWRVCGSFFEAQECTTTSYHRLLLSLLDMEQTLWTLLHGITLISMTNNVLKNTSSKIFFIIFVATLALGLRPIRLANIQAKKEAQESNFMLLGV